MEEVDQKMFKEIVENVFMRWTALKAAVEHGMGGKSGHQVKQNRIFNLTVHSPYNFDIYLLQTAVESMNYVYEYCIGNDNVTQSEIQEILDEIMDQEFDTICEDNSTIGRQLPFV